MQERRICLSGGAWSPAPLGVLPVARSALPGREDPGPFGELWAWLPARPEAPAWEGGLGSLPAQSSSLRLAPRWKSCAWKGHWPQAGRPLTPAGPGQGPAGSELAGAAALDARVTRAPAQPRDQRPTRWVFRLYHVWCHLLVTLSSYLSSLCGVFMLVRGEPVACLFSSIPETETRPPRCLLHPSSTDTPHSQSLWAQLL